MNNIHCYYDLLNCDNNDGDNDNDSSVVIYF